MFKRSSLCLLMLMVLVAGVCAQDTAAVRREIEAQYARVSAAFKRKDAQAMLALATPDLQVKTPTGRTLDRKAAQENLQSNLDTIHTIREDQYRIGKVTMKAGSALVDVTERYTVAFMDSRGEFGAIGKMHTVAGTTTYRDTWVRQEDAWMMRRSEILGTKVTLDGRPYRPRTTRPRKPSGR